MYLSTDVKSLWQLQMQTHMGVFWWLTYGDKDWQWFSKMVKQRITSLNLVYAFLHNNKLYTKTGVKLVFVYKTTYKPVFCLHETW